MCGRYIVTSPLDLLRARFGFGGEAPAVVPRYNVAPREEAPVVAVGREGERRLVSMGWGLVPSWTKDLASARRPINARAEGAAERATFRGPLRSRRALVPADGFYEWRAAPGGKGKVPYLFRLAGGGPFAFAGLWDSWKAPDGGTLLTFTLLTTTPNVLVARVHDRMPVILPREAEPAWLDPARKEPGELEGLLVPFPAEAMEGYPVSPRVGNSRHDDPSNVLPAGPPLEPER